MKKQNYILKIDKPCEQKWSSMAKTEMGSFCSSCAKTVIDFTQLSDNEVVQIINNNSDTMCGRLTQSQLNRPLQLSSTTVINTSFYKMIVTSLLIIGSSGNLRATEAPKLQQKIVFIDEHNNKSVPLAKKESEPVTDSLKNVVRGVVIDATTKEPVPFVNVYIKKSKTGVISDRNGEFTLVIPDNLVTKNIYLVAESIDYQRTEIIINKNDLPISKTVIVVDANEFVIGHFENIKK